MPPSRGQIAAAVRRAREAQRRILAMERQDLREIRVILAEARADLLARLSSGTGFERSRVLTLLQEVDRTAFDLERRLGGSILGTQSDAVRLSKELSDANLRGFGVDPFRLPPVIRISDLIASQTDAVADQIVGVTEAFRAQARGVVRSALLGQMSLAQAEKRLGRTLPGPGPFGSLATRARLIVRNETSNTFQIAHEAHREEVRKAGIGFKKRWITSRDLRVRPSHVALDNVAVEADGFFDVGGNPASRPKDPSLPPEESIQCRCIVIEEIDAEISNASGTGGPSLGFESALPALSVR